MKTYGEYPPVYISILMYIGIALMTVLFVSSALTGVLNPHNTFNEKFMSALFILPFPFAWYWILTLAHEVIIEDNGLITFRSQIRRTTISISDIQRIRVFFPNFVIGPVAYITVMHKGGRIHVTRVRGLSKLLDTLKSMNPSIELKGSHRL